MEGVNLAIEVVDVCAAVVNAADVDISGAPSRGGKVGGAQSGGTTTNVADRQSISQSRSKPGVSVYVTSTQTTPFPATALPHVQNVSTCCHDRGHTPAVEVVAFAFGYDTP